jgi:hypothetical protein
VFFLFSDLKIRKAREGAIVMCDAIGYAVSGHSVIAARYTVEPLRDDLVVFRKIFGSEWVVGTCSDVEEAVKFCSWLKGVPAPDRDYHPPRREQVTFETHIVPMLREAGITAPEVVQT